jgi:TonB family protein
MEKGAKLISKGKYKDAIAQFEKVIGKWCEYGSAYDYRCYCHMKSGNIDAAVSDIVRSVRTGKERAKTAELFDKLSQSAADKLIDELKKECEVNPMRRNLYYYLGLAYQAKGEMDKATEAFAESGKEYKRYRVRATLYTKPYFTNNDPGEFGKWVNSQISYPEIAKAYELDGSVRCSFWIDEEGKISNVRVVDDVHYDFDSQMVKVIESSPAWHPATADGNKVKTMHVFTMNYLLE